MIISTPPVAIRAPTEIRLPYPRLSISGSRSDPSMAVPAMAEPLIAAKIMPPMLLTMLSRAGMRPSHMSTPSRTLTASPE